MPEPITAEDTAGMADVIRLGWFLVVTAGQWIKSGEVDIADAKKASGVIRESAKAFLDKIIADRANNA